jgi:CBS domain-containing protein
MSEMPDSLQRRLAVDQQTMARPLRALLHEAPLTCGEATRVGDAVRRMQERGVGSIVVVDAEGRPEGIFTERDLLRSVAQRLTDPLVSEVMTRSPIALQADAFAYEAGLEMIQGHIRHVLVMEGDRLAGVVSERDLFSMRELGLGQLTMQIRAATDVEVLARLAAEIRKLAALLVAQGVAPEPLTHFVTMLNDRLSQRILELARKHHGWEGIAWTWLAFGSEGRLEQTFSTDQDNGIVFLAAGGTPPAEVRAKLLPFAKEVNQALDACGFPLCKGNVMASNPDLCLSLPEWKAKIEGWLQNTDPVALLESAICFDFRALYGDATLVPAMRDWLFERVRARPVFLHLMAENTVKARPPLGVLRDFVTEDVPGAPHSIDLKLHGVRPFVDAARIFALAQGLPETSTTMRLRAAREGLGMNELALQAAVQAFGFIQGLRLRQQASHPGERQTAPNRVDPAQLNPLDRKILRQSFRLGRELLDRLALDYRL